MKATALFLFGFAASALAVESLTGSYPPDVVTTQVPASEYLTASPTDSLVILTYQSGKSTHPSLQIASILIQLSQASTQSPSSILLPHHDLAAATHPNLLANPQAKPNTTRLPAQTPHRLPLASPPHFPPRRHLLHVPAKPKLLRPPLRQVQMVARRPLPLPPNRVLLLLTHYTRNYLERSREGWLQVWRWHSSNRRDG